MSHEIRTPLNAVLGTSAILAKTSLSKEQAGQLKLIRSSGQTLLALINEILDFSKIEAGQLRLESVAFDLEETLLETLNMLSYRANEQQLRLFWQFDSSLEGEFIGDPTRVKQVVINLLSNAVKFTRKGYVELRVKRAELGDLQCDALALSESVGADAQMIVIEVEDTGMGIAADKIDSLFDAFTQSDNSITREYGGTGLGLAITKRLLKMMGGGIEIESEQGKGSLFRMCLPLTPSPASVAEKTPQVQVQSQQAPVRILVIGDTSLFTPRVVRRLAPWGYQLSELDPGDNMLDRLHQADVLRSDELPAELIIVEQHRGMVEGSALSRVIRQFYSSAQLPVIAVSDIHLSCNIEALQRDGINGLAALALKGEVLRDMLEAVLNERGEERSKDGALFHHPQGSSEDQTEDDAIFSGRVLVVEDVEANRQVAAAILDDLGLSFRFAENGQQGLEIWKASLANKQQHFDLILMDLHMPVMDGLSATRAIREYEAQCRERRKGGFLATPIIVLSADVLQDTRQELETSGVDGYVSKPILLESLTSELKKYLPWQLRQSSTGQDEASLVSAGEIADGADLAVVDKPVVDKPVVDRPVVDRPVVDQTDADTEIFNYQELFQRVRKREDRVKSLTASFLENFAQYDADLQQALNSGDYAAIELHGHSIKGSAANLAAKQLSTLAAGIEQGAKAHEDLEHLRQQGALVTEAFERFSQEVARLIV
jgi:CheY-like chemotaxis protein